MDYSRFGRSTGGSNANGFTPGRGLSVGEIMSRREGRSNAYDARTGQAVAPGTRLMASGWNTSGVGPGTRGYRGSYANGGYNYGEGTRRPSARTADEFYAQRDEAMGNPLDNLELGNSNMMKSFLQNAMAEARGLTGTGPQVGQGNAQEQDVWAQSQSFMPGTGPQAPAGQAAVSQEPDAMEIQQMIADARRQETQDMLAARANQDPSMSFFGGEGTTPGATIEGMPADLYFQYKANEQGQGNRFAGDPYAGGDTDEAWRYSQRLAPFLKKLGIGQQFPSRRPL